MTARTWLYNQMATNTALVSLVGGLENPRIFAKKSMTSSVEDHPYIVYKLGYNASEQLSEDPDVPDPERQFVQIFIHDFHDRETGDYGKIDEVITALKHALAKKDGPGIYFVRYLETSQDLNDDTLNTLMKYVRFQIVKEGEA